MSNPLGDLSIKVGNKIVSNSHVVKLLLVIRLLILAIPTAMLQSSAKKLTKDFMHLLDSPIIWTKKSYESFSIQFKFFILNR